MSNGIEMQEAGGNARSKFTIEVINGCSLIFGQVPITDFTRIVKGYSKKSVMAIDIASRIGATMVVGEPAAIEELRKMKLPISKERQIQSDEAEANNLPKVAEWLAEGERGASSEAMCLAMYGICRNAWVAHPHDPDDLRRCLLFLDATDSHDKVHMMASVSPQWAKLVARWDELMSIFKKELAAGDRCSVTYALMKEILA